jgi:hypothetical protein
MDQPWLCRRRVGKGIKAIVRSGAGAIRRAPRSRSCGCSGWPSRWAPTTARWIRPSPSGACGLGAAAGVAAAGAVVPQGAEARRQLPVQRLCRLGKIIVAERRRHQRHAKGQAGGVKPAGTATALQSSRLTKLV